MEEITENEDNPVLFEVVGLVTTTPFQQCRLSVEKLHWSRPGLYSQPKIRPMLNVEWDEYKTKVCTCLINLTMLLKRKCKDKKDNWRNFVGN